MRILMVCLGNICRSPLAEGIMRSQLSEDFTIDSAGTGNWHVGNQPDKRSIAIAKHYGIDISKQRARQFRLEDFDNFDLIFTMDASNYADVIALTNSEENHKKVKLILGDQNVPDPYYGGDDGFDQVYHLLNDAIHSYIQQHNLK